MTLSEQLAENRMKKQEEWDAKMDIKLTGAPRALEEDEVEWLHEKEEEAIAVEKLKQREEQLQVDQFHRAVAESAKSIQQQQQQQLPSAPQLKGGLMTSMLAPQVSTTKSSSLLARLKPKGSTSTASKTGVSTAGAVDADGRSAKKVKLSTERDTGNSPVTGGGASKSVTATKKPSVALVAYGTDSDDDEDDE